MIEHEAFQREFWNSKLLICLFHALYTFWREITTNKSGITTQGQRVLCLEIIQKMGYAENKDKYMEYYNQLKGNNPKCVDYFSNHWHNIKNQ